MRRLLPILSIVVLSACAAPEPPPEPGDPAVVDANHYSVIFENDSVRLLKFSYAPGATSNLHRHPDLVAVILSGGTGRFTGADGVAEEVPSETDSGMYMPASVHTVQNIGSTPMEGVLVELKGSAAPTATIPTEREGMMITTLADGPRAVALKVTADATFAEPAGTTHDYDQVVIALGPAEVALTVDGAPARSTWARGDAQFIGRGVAHESKSAGTGPVEFVIVAIR